MTSAQVGTYTNLRIESSVSAYDAAGNWTDVAWSLHFDERSGSNNLAWASASPGVTASVSITSLGAVWSGTFGYDWRPAGLQSKVIASGTSRVYHNADGTPPASFTVSGANGATGSSGGGSGGSVAMALTLPTLKVLPGTPNTLVATYISDTQVDLTWAHTSASNGQPDTNKIQKKVNDGAWVDVATVSATTAASVAVAANQKIEFQVLATNAAGSTAYSAASAPVYTTPGAPTSAVATKTGADIVLTFAENVDYSAYNHEVWHGTITGGVTTWDGAALTTLAAAVLTYTHVTPNPAQVHVYRVRAKQGALYSGYATSNSVQLLTAPAKPTIPATAPYADKASIFRFSWVHNPVDSSAQTKRQVRYSTDGGSTWTTGAKTVSTDQFIDFAANTWAANAAVTFEVRTKGDYDSGADGDASYSPWSDPTVVTFKTVPVATIVSPANASVLNTSTLAVTLGFAQAEAATFVRAQVELLQAAVLLEAVESVNLVGIPFATPVLNGGAYDLRARVQDSNGIWSAWATSAFTVVYLAPVPADVTLTFLPDNGWGQIDLVIAAPGVGQAAATTVSITRAIDGGTPEVIVTDYPVASPMTFLDTTPVTHGTNTYTVTTKSALGAQSIVVEDLVTEECRRAYLSKDAAYSTVGTFGANLEVSESLSVASDTIQTAGRTKPVGLFGVETSVSLKVSSFVFEDFGSTVDEMRALLLVPGKACFRDASGRRVFGTVKGSVSYKKVGRADLGFTLEETS